MLEREKEINERSSIYSLIATNLLNIYVYKDLHCTLNQILEKYLFFFLNESFLFQSYTCQENIYEKTTELLIFFYKYPNCYLIIVLGYFYLSPKNLVFKNTVSEEKCVLEFYELINIMSKNKMWIN